MQAVGGGAAATVSVCYSLACHVCRVALWVAQSSASRGLTLYTSQARTMALLAKFLLAHESHPLVFSPSADMHDAMREIEDDAQDVCTVAGCALSSSHTTEGHACCGVDGVNLNVAVA